MTRKKPEALVLKQFRAVSALISPLKGPFQHCITKDVKLDEHDIDFVIEIAERMKHIQLKRIQVVAAISDYYLTVIKPANPYIVGFRFLSTWDYGKNILKVIATIRVNLKAKQSDSPISGKKVSHRKAPKESPEEFKERFLRAQRGLLFNPLA